MYTEQTIEATKEIAKKFIENEISFLTESDFKVTLSNQIKSKFNSRITVNTESPWYDTYVTNRAYFIDITAFNQDKLQITYDPKLNRKGYKYDAEALAVELKYFRYNNDINEIEKDFFKTTLLVKEPANECFIIAAARTIEIFDDAKEFMANQMEKYRKDYDERVKVFLFGPMELIEIK